MINVYIDCNILIDWLLNREPYSYYAAKVIEYTEKKRIKSYVSVLTLANTYYIITKELNKKIGNEFLKDSTKIFHIADIPETTIIDAINKPYKDFEDSLHYYTALENNLEYIITRNKKHFARQIIKILDAEEFVKSNIV